MTEPHPLIGKILRHMDEETETYCVSHILADLGRSLLLARRLDPSTGSDLPLRHIINLATLVETDEIFDDFAEMEKYYADDETDDLVEQAGHHTIQ